MFSTSFHIKSFGLLKRCFVSELKHEHFRVITSRLLHGITCHPILEPAISLLPQKPSIQPIRTNVRKHFPRPKEYQRVKKHGWKTRLSTPGGRAIIMRRILKGRFVLSH